MFHMKHSRLALFANAEIPEDHIQEILDIDPARNPAQRPRRQAQVLRHEFRLAVPALKSRGHMTPAVDQGFAMPVHA